MTRQSRQGPKSGRAAGGTPLARWPGLLLNLLLPGSGLSYLGRPWLHLGALLLTLLIWFLAWMVMLDVAHNGQSSQTAYAPTVAITLEFLAGLMAISVYGLLGWSYLATYRKSASDSFSAWRWLPILVHALLLGYGIWWSLVRLNPPY